MPVEERDLSLVRKVQNGSGDQAELFSMRSFAELKRLGHDIYHSPPSSAEAKNERSHNSTRPIRPHGVNRDKIIFLISNI